MKANIKMLFINGPIDDGSIPKGIEPFAVFNMIIHADKVLPMSVSVEISFEIVETLFEFVFNCLFEEQTSAVMPNVIISNIK